MWRLRGKLELAVEAKHPERREKRPPAAAVPRRGSWQTQQAADGAQSSSREASPTLSRPVHVEEHLLGAVKGDPFFMQRVAAAAGVGAAAALQGSPAWGGARRRGAGSADARHRVRRGSPARMKQAPAGFR